MQRINVTPLVKPILDAFHYGRHNVSFSRTVSTSMFGSTYANDFVALSEAPDWETSARAYLTSDDLTLDQLKDAAAKVGFDLEEPTFDDRDLAEALENYSQCNDLDNIGIKKWDVYNSMTEFFSWAEGGTLFKNFRDMAESDSDYVLQAFKDEKVHVLEYVDDSTRFTYVSEQAERLIDHIASYDDWHKLGLTPERVEADAWYVLDAYVEGSVEFNGMYILPCKE